MVNQETLGGSQRIESLQNEDLISLISVLERPTELYKPDRNIARSFKNILTHSYNNEQHDILRESVMNLGNNPDALQVFSHVYPGASQEDMDQLIKLDMSGLVRIKNASYDKDDYLFDYEWRAVGPFVFGSEVSLRPFPFWVSNIEDASPLVRKRITEGMPRQLQLIAISSVISGLSSTPEYNSYSIQKIKKISEVFQLSPDEFRAVTRISHDMSVINHNVALLAINDIEFIDLLRKEDGEIDIDLFGGDEALKAAISDVFGSLVAHNHKAEQIWTNLVNHLGTQKIESLFPYESRREIVLNSIRQNPSLPSDILKGYVSAIEVANAAKDKIQASLNSDLPRVVSGRYYYSVIHAAAEFGLDELPFRLHEINKYEKLVNLMLDSADEGSELYVQAANWLEKINSIDNYLYGLLKGYAMAKSSPGRFPLPIDGWTGDPEETDYIDAHLRSGQLANEQIAELEVQIKAYINFV